MKLHESSWAWLVVGGRVLLWRYLVSTSTAIVRSINITSSPLSAGSLIFPHPPPTPTPHPPNQVTLQSTHPTLLINWVEGRPCHYVHRPWQCKVTISMKGRHIHVPSPLPLSPLLLPFTTCHRASVLAVSPEGAVRYWDNITSDNPPYVEGHVDVGEASSVSLASLPSSPTCLLLTSQAHLFALSPPISGAQVGPSLGRRGLE